MIFGSKTGYANAAISADDELRRRHSMRRVETQSFREVPTDRWPVYPTRLVRRRSDDCPGEPKILPLPGGFAPSTLALQ
jgi:hypothetical protein